jgi:hypothetical protein
LRTLGTAKAASVAAAITSPHPTIVSGMPTPAAIGPATAVPTGTKTSEPNQS